MYYFYYRSMNVMFMVIAERRKARRLIVHAHPLHHVVTPTCFMSIFLFVYNLTSPPKQHGKRLIDPPHTHLLSHSDIHSCVQSIKTKQSEDLRQDF